MNKMKWKVMRVFGKLPSSPDIQDMNDAQWAWCYLNIIDDIVEEEELWKSRAKYSGLFVNPEGVRAMAKAEEKEKQRKARTINSPTQQNEYISNESDSEDEQIYVSSDFEKELELAMSDKENFMELPEPDDQRGDSSMSSEEFVNFMNGNLDKFDELQKQIDFNKKVQTEMEQYDDLDIIEID